MLVTVTVSFIMMPSTRRTSISWWWFQLPRIK
ncbi:hypothetical protein E2C01_090114 [Portunus trituberculatus]|uniref:Uncharacterized protein n=1 Tax=Portunus trituberculatus TaxID=210409 RepID=A0A5B7JKI7_PORTR|nr:hypothetical protein [Portunus trituberculatus]